MPLQQRQGGAMGGHDLRSSGWIGFQGVGTGSAIFHPFSPLVVAFPLILGCLKSRFLSVADSLLNGTAGCVLSMLYFWVSRWSSLKRSSKSQVGGLPVRMPIMLTRNLQNEVDTVDGQNPPPVVGWFEHCDSWVHHINWCRILSKSQQYVSFIFGTNFEHLAWPKGNEWPSTLTLPNHGTAKGNVGLFVYHHVPSCCWSLKSSLRGR